MDDWQDKYLPVPEITRSDIIWGIIIFISVTLMAYGFINYALDCNTAGGFLFGDCK